MKKILFLPFLALLIMGLVSCEKELIETENGFDSQELMSTIRSNGKATVPFHGVFANSIDPDSTYFDEEGNLHEFMTGIGHASHLGNCTLHASTTVYTGFYLEPPPEPPYIQNGDNMTFVAADGSTFTCSYAGTTSPGTPPVFFAGDGTWEINEGMGTKRFVGTTGSGTYSYVAIMDADGNVSSEFEITGTLTNP